MLLSDEEIISEARKLGIDLPPLREVDTEKAIAKAQAKKIFDELERHVYATFPESGYVYIPVEIWQQFRKGVE